MGWGPDICQCWRSRLGHFTFRAMVIQSFHSSLCVCVFSILQQPPEQCHLPWLFHRQRGPVEFTWNISPPFHWATARIHFPRIREILKYDFWNLTRYIPVLQRTPKCSAEPWVHCYQDIKNVGPFGQSHQCHNLLAMANNSSISSLTFWGDVSPGNRRLWSTRRYAGEADIVPFINGDIWRNLHNFGRYCGNKAERKEIKILLKHFFVVLQW